MVKIVLRGVGCTVGGVSATPLGFIRPEDNGRMALLIDGRVGDLTDHDLTEIVHLSDTGCVGSRQHSTVFRIGPRRVQPRVSVVILVWRDDAVIGQRAVGQVVRELGQRRIVGGGDIGGRRIARPHRAAIGDREEK